MADYKVDIIQRFWNYQKTQYPNWEAFFDRPCKQDLRPPVFLIDQAWRNVIVNPLATHEEIDKLIAMLPNQERHKWFRSMNSSQALTHSVFGNLALYGYLPCLSEVQDDDGKLLFEKARLSNDDLALEFKVTYLGEPRSTSIDAYIVGDYRIAVECKFIETEVGTCSRPRLTPLDSNYENEFCNGTYACQSGRQELCSLTEKGVLYWNYIPTLFNWEKEQDRDPCMLNSNYQLVRNVLSVAVTSDKKVSSANGHAVLIYDERNPAFQLGGKGFMAFEETRQSLREPALLRKCSWQRLIQHIRNTKKLNWLTDQLALKYGM